MKNLAEKKKTKPSVKPFGTLYHHSMGKTSASVTLNPRPVTKREHTRKVVGAGITSLAMALYVYSYGPITSAQMAPEPIVAQVAASEANPPPVTQETPVSQEFTISIPFLKTEARVLPQVNPSNEAEYSEALSQGVAQAKGTAFPGDGKRIFLFAHSTNSIFNVERYNAIFYDLGKITEGELISISYKGKIHQYRVSEKKVVQAQDVSWLEPQDGEVLILQTCYPPGTSWKRLLVFAYPI